MCDITSYKHVKSYISKCFIETLLSKCFIEDVTNSMQRDELFCLSYMWIINLTIHKGGVP